VKLCLFAANLYPHTITTFDRFILMFNKMALIFYRAAWNADAVLRWNYVRPSVRLSVRPTNAWIV